MIVTHNMVTCDGNIIIEIQFYGHSPPDHQSLPLTWQIYMAYHYHVNTSDPSLHFVRWLMWCALLKLNRGKPSHWVARTNRGVNPTSSPPTSMHPVHQRHDPSHLTVHVDRELCVAVRDLVHARSGGRRGAGRGGWCGHRWPRGQNFGLVSRQIRRSGVWFAPPSGWRDPRGEVRSGQSTRPCCLMGIWHPSGAH